MNLDFMKPLARQKTQGHRSYLTKRNASSIDVGDEGDMELQSWLADVSADLETALNGLARVGQRAARRDEILREDFKRELAELQIQHERECQAIRAAAEEALVEKSRELDEAQASTHDREEQLLDARVAICEGEELLCEARTRILDLEEQLREARAQAAQVISLEKEVSEIEPMMLKYQNQLAALESGRCLDAQYIAKCENELRSQAQIIESNVKPCAELQMTIEGLEKQKTKTREALDFELCRSTELKRQTLIQSKVLVTKDQSIARLESHNQSLLNLLGGSITPRTVLMILELRRQSEKATVVYNVPNKELLDGITVDAHEMLMPLRYEQIPRAMTKYTELHKHLISSNERGLSWKKCQACKLTKIHWETDETVSAAPNTKEAYDFLLDCQKSPCCQKYVCKICILRSIELSVAAHLWWTGIQNEGNQWLICPITGCNVGLSPWQWISRSSRAFRWRKRRNLSKAFPGFAMSLGMPEIVAQQFGQHIENTLVFRKCLYGIAVDLNASNAGARLFKQLDDQGFIQNMKLPMRCAQECVLHRNSPGVQCSTSRAIRTKMGDYNYGIPVLTIAMKREEGTRSCVICSEEYHEIARRSEEDWTLACKDFEGAWMHDIFYFPARTALACTHESDTCRECYRRQINTQLEKYGRQACDQLTCPTCDRKLSYGEIQVLAAKEDFTRYERYLLLNALSEDPNFRWCLSPDCDSGQLYGSPEDFVRPQIECQECQFQMCYKHQTPWHDGLTCTQYDSKVSHAKEEGMTAEWKEKHTKLCPGPGCGKPIAKGEGCFHMTCYQCRYEFCWECLADWKKVRSEKSAHNPGCFFLTSNYSPTAIQGTTIEAATA